MCVFTSATVSMGGGLSGGAVNALCNGSIPLLNGAQKAWLTLGAMPYSPFGLARHGYLLAAGFETPAWNQWRARLFGYDFGATLSCPAGASGDLEEFSS